MPLQLTKQYKLTFVRLQYVALFHCLRHLPIQLKIHVTRYFCGLFYNAFSRWKGEDLAVSGRGLSQTLSCHFPGHKNNKTELMLSPCGKVDGQIHLLLTSTLALEVCGHPQIPGASPNQGSHRIWGWVDHGTGYDDVNKRKPYPFWDSNWDKLRKPSLGKRRCPCQDSNRAFLEYKSWSLPLRHSVRCKTLCTRKMNPKSLC